MEKETVKRKEQLDEMDDGEIAVTLDGQRLAMHHAVSDVSEALRNDDVPLTDEKVDKLDDVRSELWPLIEELAFRVPPEHRIE